jgi:hypothetical protein
VNYAYYEEKKSSGMSFSSVPLQRTVGTLLA